MQSRIRKYCILLITVFCLFCTLPAYKTNTIQAKGRSIVQKIAVDGDYTVTKHNLPYKEIEKADLATLRIIRNTIFAKYGYCFKSRDLRDHFKKFPWYSCKSANVDHLLNRVDRHNIEMIRQIELRVKYRDQDKIKITGNLLVGFWHSRPFISDASCDRYIFKKNHRFIFALDDYDCVKRTISYEGTWEIKNNTLILVTDTRNHVTGGHIVRDELGKCAGEKMLVDGKKKKSKIKPVKKKYDIPFIEFKEILNSGQKKFIMKIGGTVFYKNS